MPPSSLSSGWGAQFTGKHVPCTQKPGLCKMKAFQGLPGACRERRVLIPDVHVCLSNFSSDLPSLPSPSSVWKHSPDCSVSSAGGDMESRASDASSPLSPPSSSWPHRPPSLPAARAGIQAPSHLLLSCSRSDKQQHRRIPSAGGIMSFALGQHQQHHP